MLVFVWEAECMLHSGVEVYKLIINNLRTENVQPY